MSETNVELSRFIDILDSRDGKDKLAQVAEPFIRDKLREDSFAAKVLPPEDITPADCVPSTESDTLVKIVEVEPSTKGALPVTFRGGTSAQLVKGPRIALPFYSIMSPMFTKTVQELLAYRMPVTKMIEEFSVKDIEMVYDYQFTRHIESSVQYLQKEANGGVATALSASTIQAGTVVESHVSKGELARNANVDNLYVYPIMRADFARLFNMLEREERKADTILMTATDYNQITSWTSQDLGYTVASDTLENGLKFNTLFGKKVVVTLKTQVLREGNVYVFTSPEFLGKFYVLNKIQFYTNKIVNRIEFCAWGDITMGIVNIASVAKLELYSQNVEPETGDPADVAAKNPLAPEELSKRYNKVWEGGVYPGIKIY